MSLVLSLFPGLGLLDRAFEEEGFCVVRGPDVLWGGDIRRFHPPAGRFDGVIGGPPCPSHSPYARLIRAQGREPSPDLLPEFARCVREASPSWWLMENSVNVPTLELPGFSAQRIVLNARQVGLEQDRTRVFQFGSADGLRIVPEVVALEPVISEPPCLATEGRAGRMQHTYRNGNHETTYYPRRGWSRFCELQGIPDDFLPGGIFTVEGKYRVVGNGVPIPMGRAIARAVKAALESEVTA